MEISFLHRYLSQFSPGERTLLIQVGFRNEAIRLSIIASDSYKVFYKLGDLLWNDYPLWDDDSELFPRPLAPRIEQWLEEIDMGISAPGRYSYPLHFGGFVPFYWVHKDAIAPIFAYQQVEQSLLLTLQRAAAFTFTVEKLKKIPTAYHFEQQLLAFFCESLAPVAYRRKENALWVPYCRSIYDDKDTVEYDLPVGKLRAGTRDQGKSQWLQEQLISIYEGIQERWELCHQQSVQIANQIEELTAKVEKSQLKLEEYFNTHKIYMNEIAQLKQVAARLIQPGVANAFEFFRGTESWVIRFENKPVKMKNKYTLGLIYIHQLLLNPDVDIYCQQLYLRSNQDLRQASPVWKEIHQRFDYQSLADNEQEWQSAIARIEKSISTASADIKIDLMEYIVFLAEQRYRNHISRANLEKLIYYQKKLKLAKIETESTTSSDVHYRRQVTLKGVLFKNAEHPKDQYRKIYQNVTKAIKRTVEAMDDKAIVNYFQQCLKIGNPCCYKPDLTNIDPPIWKLWAD